MAKKRGVLRVAKTRISPDPEVDAKPSRRTFTAQYKLRILKEADACTGDGQIGALLRREGLYSSHLSKWREQREAGSLRELGKKRGRRPTKRDREKEKLERRCARLERENEQLKMINEIQKKVAGILGIPLSSPDSDDND
jgi:transposase-like protein